MEEYEGTIRSCNIDMGRVKVAETKCEVSFYLPVLING